MWEGKTITMLLAKDSQKMSSSTPSNDVSSAKNFEDSPPSIHPACTVPWNIKNYVVCEGTIARGMSVGLY
ncbi:hypothetical protein CEXT_806561 [Caerostris extrusa]|uniref:Uncharacterized protein n=1 Tax=Caerostris extrusa TaxID=172846 RepID=A0AAV4UCK6_CAEEX|nr:hypothetical protein CEXT_806561 [Caerostris extrusa]